MDEDPKFRIFGMLWEIGKIMNHHCNYRILKVEEIGDFWRHSTIPRIRLKGKWMIKAGILPNNHVQVSNPQPGVLVLQILDEEI